MKPAQAACISTAGQLSLSWSCTRQAVEGNDMSGENVGQQAEIDVAVLTPARSMHFFAAW